MKILLIHQYYLEEDDPGGSRFNEMVKEWEMLGHNTTVIAGMMHYSGHEKRQEYKGKWLVKKQQGKQTVWRGHVSEAYNKNFLGRLWAYFSFVISSTYIGLFKAKDKYDIILVTSPPLFVGISGYIISRWKRIPLVFEVRDLWPESAIDTGVIKNKCIIKLAYWFEKFIYRKSKIVNVLTPAFRRKLIEKGVEENKIIFVPNAADFSLSENVMENFDAQSWRVQKGFNDKFVITYVGAHGVANDLDQLLDAASKLKETQVLFQLIGDGMEKKRLKARIDEEQIQNVVLVDSVPKSEVFKYILASDMGVSVLKKVETFKTIYSNKTFDYMACKKPVLMLIDGISRELIIEAKAGYYAEPENIAEITRVIHQAIEKRSLLQQLGDNGYNYARDHFDRKKLAKKYKDEIMNHIK